MEQRTDNPLHKLNVPFDQCHVHHFNLKISLMNANLMSHVRPNSPTPSTFPISANVQPPIYLTDILDPN